MSTAITRNINIRHQAALGQRRVEETVTAVLAAAGGWGTICIQKTSTSVMFHIFSPVSTVSRRPAEPLGVMLY